MGWKLFWSLSVMWRNGWGMTMVGNNSTTTCETKGMEYGGWRMKSWFVSWLGGRVVLFLMICFGGVLCFCLLALGLGVL